jgi:tetratricopeptide (TPR) repeat protein
LSKVIIGPRSKTVAFVAILALTTFGALATAIGPADRHQGHRQGPSGSLRARKLPCRPDAQKVERLVKARFGADHPNYAVALNKLGIVFYAQGKYTDAEGFFERALTIRQKALGASHFGRRKAGVRSG